MVEMYSKHGALGLLANRLATHVRSLNLSTNTTNLRLQLQLQVPTQKMLSSAPQPDEFELHPRPRHSSSAAQPHPPPPDAFDLSSGDDDEYSSDAQSSADEDPSATARLLDHSRRLRAKRKRKLQTPHTPPWWARWLFSYPRTSPPKQRPIRRSLLGRVRRGCCQILGFLMMAIGVLLVFTAIFGGSYTHAQYPEPWRKLDESVRKGGGLNPPGYWVHLPGEGGRKKTTATGRGNPNNERIFIAANIVDAELIEKEWGSRVMELIDLLGEENVFLSIFENDSGPEARKALGTLSNRIKAHMPKAGQSIVSTTLPFSGVPRVKVPGGETYVKRITYLAEVRNRALLPLLGSIPSLARWNQTAHPPSKTPEHEDIGEWETLPPLPAEDTDKAPAMPTSWVPDPEKVSRVVFLNDVIFSPLELLHLIFSTNNGDYAAACAIDYINPFKYYDTFATRDPDGYPLGVPFFPYFATAGPLSQILSTSPTINVRSCWGGAIALNATFFTREKNPIRFRSEKEPFWDASECCLVNADINEPQKTFVNPFVRCAYDRGTFDWLPFVKRIERTFAIPHRIVDWALGMPWGGLRRVEEKGKEVKEVRWDGGKWVDAVRIAGRGGWCGGQKLLVMNEDRKKGEGSWKNIPVPVLPGS